MEGLTLFYYSIYSFLLGSQGIKHCHDNYLQGEIYLTQIRTTAGGLNKKANTITTRKHKQMKGETGVLQYIYIYIYLISTFFLLMPIANVKGNLFILYF